MLLFSSTYALVYAQSNDSNCINPPSTIINPSLNTNGSVLGDMNDGNPANTVEAWFVSHGTPSLSQNAPTNGGQNSIWMWSHNIFQTTDPSGEGIYTCYKFEQGQTYTVCLWARNTNQVDSGKLMILAANGLTPQTASNVPILSSSQIISNTYFHSAEWTEVSFTFTADSNYNQLWIYPDYNEGIFYFGDPQYELEVDLITINECCSTNEYCEFQALFDTEDSCSNPVQFTDLSNGAAGSAVAWEWDFGDGNHSIINNPEHSYDEPGIYHVCLTVTWMDDYKENSCCQKYCKEIEVCERVSVNEKNRNKNISIFPNPATSIVQINTNGIYNSKIKVFDINGKEKTKQIEMYSEGESSFSLNTRTLIPGVYFIEIYTNNGKIYREKLLIQ